MSKRLGNCGSRLCLGLLTASAMLVVGCGGAEELRSTGQASEFIDDIARGGKISEWELADDATRIASLAWLHESSIRRVGAQLREDGPQWACDTAEQVENANKVFGLVDELTDSDRRVIVGIATVRGADENEVEAFIDEALELTDQELAEAIAAVCKL